MYGFVLSSLYFGIGFRNLIVFETPVNDKKTISSKAEKRVIAKKIKYFIKTP